MFKYYTDRGLSSIEILAKNFKDRLWYVPDFIPHEVISKIREYVSEIECYKVYESLNWKTTITGNDPKVFYVIDYFGAEAVAGKSALPNTIIIRDSVWFPYPFSPVEYNHVWFNSLRKIIKGAKGSSIISPYRLSGLNEVPNIYYHPSLTWHEVNKRFENYYHCKEIFGEFKIYTHEQAFPSVMPIRLKNRDKVLAGLGSELPEVWKEHDFLNFLYKQVLLIPIDSRYNKESLTELAEKIKELNK